MSNVIHSVKLPQFSISNDAPFTLIAGPCQIESLEHSRFMCHKILSTAAKFGINVIFKSSFDKANRTSISSTRGVGMEKGLEILQSIKNEFGCPVTTDVHQVSDCDPVSKVVDVLQIPAFLSRQTDLLVAAANTGKVVNVKKGQFMSPYEVGNVTSKIESQGNSQIMLTERGFTFGYNNLVVDMRAFPIMKETGYPVLIDATHSTQAPGGLGGSSGGNRDMAPVLANAALSCGIGGVFMEVHEDPDNAPSDGKCMVKLENLESILRKMHAIDGIAKSEL